MVQIFIEGLKPEIKNEMIKKSFNKAGELEKLAEQKAMSSSKIIETSADYMGNTSNRGNNVQ